jgi:outer membrane lipoprotein-sorting protein
LQSINFSKTNRFLLLVLSFFLFACGSKISPRAALPEAESRHVLEQAEAYLQSVQILKSARGYAKVRLKVKGHQKNFDEAVIIAWPDSFRFETLDDLGNTQFLIVSDGDTLAWQDFQRKEMSSQKVNDKALARFLPVVESVTDTLGLLIGRLPPQDLKGAQVTRDAKSPLAHIHFSKGEIGWDSESGYIVSLALKDEDGKFRFQIEGRDFVDRVIRGPKESLARAPSRIHLKDLKTGNEIDLSYRDLTVEPASSKLSPSLFHVEPSSDMKRLDERDE